MSFRWPVDTALYGNTCLVLDQMIRWFAIGCLEARQLSTFKGSQTWLRSVSLQVMVALVPVVGGCFMWPVITTRRQSHVVQYEAGGCFCFSDTL